MNAEPSITTETRIIESAADVDEGIICDAEDVYDDWFAHEPRIDWEHFLDRLAKLGELADPPYDFEDFDNPAIRKIQRHVRSIRA